MGWSDRTVEGFLLAATVAEVPAEEVARASVAGPAAQRIAQAAARLRDLDAGRRRRELARIAAVLREPPPADVPMPLRARAILAREMPRDVGRVWMGAAPAPRRGFVAGPALRDVLRRAARNTRPEDPETAARERGVGREVLARSLRGLDDHARAAALEPLGPDEAAAVLSLEPLLEDDAGRDRAHEATLLRAATRTSSGTDRTRALGAMALGFRGEAGGDRQSLAWRRAGREIAEVWEAGCRG